MVLLIDTQPKGPAMKFNDAELFFLLDHLSRHGRVGRQPLARLLHIGEGSVRGMLALLQNYGFVDVERTGVALTPYGRSLLDALGIRTVDIYLPHYVIGSCQQGIVVRNAVDKVFNGIEQRNAGIRAGGDGCSTWAMRDGTLYMLPNWNVDENKPTVAAIIRRETGLAEGEVLIVGGGDDPHVAMMAAGTAALDIVRSEPRGHPRAGALGHDGHHAEQREAQLGRDLQAPSPAGVPLQDPPPGGGVRVRLLHGGRDLPGGLVPPVGLAVGAPGGAALGPGDPRVPAHHAGALLSRPVPRVRPASGAAPGVPRPAVPCEAAAVAPEGAAVVAGPEAELPLAVGTAADAVRDLARHHRAFDVRLSVNHSPSSCGSG